MSRLYRQGSVITAGILSICFIENEIQRLYRDLISKEGIPGIDDDIVYLHDDSPLTFKHIYAKTVSLFSSHDDPGEVLQLLQSSNSSERRKGLQLLSTSKGWRDDECRLIAQSCDNRIIASLARTKDVDLRFFRPMPKLEADFQFQYPFKDNEPGEDESSYSEYESSPDELTEETMDESSSQDNESTEEVSKYKDYKSKLIKLARETLDAEKCAQFIKDGGLGFLQEILMLYTSDKCFTKLIACVLANLTMVTELHSNIIQGGWAMVLHQWMSSDNLAVFFHSCRALANLDQDWDTDLRIPAMYRDSIFLGHPLYRSSNTDTPVTVDIVYLHGLKGGPFKTWRQKDKPIQEHGSSHSRIFWPKDWLVPDLQDNVRIVNIGFDAALTFSNSETAQNITSSMMIQTGNSLLHKLQQADVGSRPIIWVGHSMGGLLIKEILFLADTDPKFKQFNTNTRGVIFYSTPHKGSNVANVTNTFLKPMFPILPMPAVHDLKYENEYLAMLHKSFIFTVLRYDIPCLSFGEEQSADFGQQVSLKIVDLESADPNVGEFHKVACTHLNICKPESKDSQLYRLTLAFVQRSIENIHKNADKQEDGTIQRSLDF